MGCRSGPWRHSTRLMSYPAQSFLSVFRSLAMVEKTVEKCCISLSGSNSHLVVQLYCKYGEQAAGQPGVPSVGAGGSDVKVAKPTETLSPYPGVKKTHNLSFQDCESLQAVFNPGSCPHLLRAPAR